MGFLSLFSKSAPAEPTLLRLPTGSFTVDREGSVLVGTLPSSFPQDMIAAIAEVVLQTFREAPTLNVAVGNRDSISEPENLRARTARRRHHLPFTEKYRINGNHKINQPLCKTKS